MQSQQQIIASTVTPQQHVTLVTSTVKEEILERRRKIIYALGKAELTIGCLMTAIGIFTSIYVPIFSQNASSYTFHYINNYDNKNNNYNYNNYNYYYRYYSVITIGEGIWCGIWVIIAGGLGMGAGAKTSTPCLINTHMGFSIVGALASGAMCGLTATWAAISSRVAFYCALMSTMSVVSFATAVLLIVSASYCCCTNPAGCCGQQTYPRGPNVAMPQYVNTPGLAPVQVQGPNPMTTTTTYYHQNQAPAQPGSSNMYHGNTVPAPSTSLPVKSDALNQGLNSPLAYQGN